MKTKICTKCKKELPATEEFFYRRKTRNKRLLSRCKKCVGNIAKKHCKDHPEKHRAKSKKQAKENRLEYINIKGGKCQLCGYDDCVGALEFHHVDPSIKECDIPCVSKKKRAIKELEKCILICANCHRKIHYTYGYRNFQKNS